MRVSRAIMGSLLLCGAGATQAGARAKAGHPAPNFTLVTYDKQEIALADLRGNVVIINYWATWCGPCKTELPQLDAYYRAHAKRGLRTYAITTEGSVPMFKLRPLAAMLAFPTLRKLKGGGYGTIGGAVPTNYVIDRQGVVRYAAAGAFDAATLKAIVDPLLAEQAIAAH